MVKGILAAGAAVVIGMSVVACGGGSGPAGGSSVDGTSGVSISGTPTVVVKEVNNGSYVFSPATVTLKVGQVVEWEDDSSGVPHNVTFTGAASGLSGPTGTNNWEVKFIVAGTYNYKCTLHTGMTGTVTVTS